MRRLVVGAVVGAVLALAVAGCGGDPKADPPPTPSPSVSASTTAAPPVMPEAAKANTKAGAVAFVKYYIELINHAQATGDVKALAVVEDPACKSCASARDALAAIYRSGGHIDGGILTFKPSAEARNPRYRGWVISGSLHFEPEAVTREAGGTAETLKGGQAVVNAFVSAANEASQWRVMDWTRGS